MGNMLDSFIKSFIVAEKKRFCLVLGRHLSMMAKLSSDASQVPGYLALACLNF